MKINLSFFKCEIYGAGAWFRFGILGGFSIRDRTKSRPLFSERQGITKSLKIGKYSLYRLKP
jgi:hypothetical protein